MRALGRSLLLTLTILALASGVSVAQTPTVITVGQAVTAIVVVPISNTAAVNTAVTLTIPTPAAGLYNYVCSLSYALNQDGTSSAVTNAVTTSTNFNSFALKVSLVATANLSSGIVNLFTLSPAGGCVKSAVAGTATTFVSPASLTNTAWSWYATYFVAP